MSRQLYCLEVLLVEGEATPDDAPIVLWPCFSSDFITSYENAFNERLTPDQANELFDRLLDLYARIKRVADKEPELPTIDALGEDNGPTRQPA